MNSLVAKAILPSPFVTTLLLLCFESILFRGLVSRLPKDVESKLYRLDNNNVTVSRQFARELHDVDVRLMSDKITSLINRLGRSIHCRQYAQGLNPAQWEALRYLSRANRYSRTPSALAEYLHTTKGTASQTLKSLEAKGYVRRVPIPEDRRAVRIDITDAGQVVLRRDPLQCLAASASELGEDLETVSRFLGRLASALERANGKDFGLCAECTYFCKNEAAGAEGGPHKCGLHDEPLSPLDSTKICVSHRCGRVRSEPAKP